MDIRHLIAYGLIVLIVMIAVGGSAILGRRRSDARRIRRGWRPPA